MDWDFIQKKTNERLSCGSVHYASPELISKDLTYDGPEIDVWSLGVILYTFLTASLPFNKDSNRELYKEIYNCNVIYYEDEFSPNIIKLLKMIFVRENRISLDEIIDYLDKHFD